VSDSGQAKGARDIPHLLLPSIGPTGLRRIRAARVLVIGAGGLGCPVLQYLAGSSVGHITVCDFDHVSESNLARQLLYAPGDVGRLKVEAAVDALRRINPEVTISPHAISVDDTSLPALVEDCELVIDACDNFDTRMAVNRACLQHRKPWVMGACVRLEGQLMPFDPRLEEVACYRCVYGKAGELMDDCAGAGVFAPVAGVIGAAMAHMALLMISGNPVASQLSVLDGAGWEWRSLSVKRDPACPECGAGSAGAVGSG
jgi:molybdopterin/thiamine biosynthesis adenylyltransferase